VLIFNAGASVFLFKLIIFGNCLDCLLEGLKL